MRCSLAHMHATSGPEVCLSLGSANVLEVCWPGRAACPLICPLICPHAVATADFEAARTARCTPHRASCLRRCWRGAAASQMPHSGWKSWPMTIANDRWLSSARARPRASSLLSSLPLARRCCDAAACLSSRGEASCTQCRRGEAYSALGTSGHAMVYVTSRCKAMRS